MAYLFSTAKLLAQTKSRSQHRWVRRQRCRHIHYVTQDGKRFTQEDIWAVRDEILKLPDHLRPYVEKHYIEEREVEEIARANGETERTVYKRLKTACALLRVRLAASSAALILPLLSGEADASLPTIAVPSGMAKRFRDRIRQGRTRAKRLKRRAGFTSGMGVLVSVAASILLMALILFLGAFSPGGRGGARRGALAARVPQAPQGEEPRIKAPDVENRGRKEPVVDSNEGSSKGGEANLLPPKAPSTPQEPPKEAEKPAPKEKASAVIRALDQKGKLLKQGMLVMRLAGEADPDEEIISGTTSLELERDSLHLPRALAQENPVLLEEIPEILNGHEIEARLRTGGVYLGEAMKFKVEAGERTEVDDRHPRCNAKLFVRLGQR